VLEVGVNEGSDSDWFGLWLRGILREFFLAFTIYVFPLWLFYLELGMFRDTGIEGDGSIFIVVEIVKDALDPIKVALAWDCSEASKSHDSTLDINPS